jgi:hypothetical protein
MIPWYRALGLKHETTPGFPNFLEPVARRFPDHTVIGDKVRTPAQWMQVCISSSAAFFGRFARLHFTSRRIPEVQRLFFDYMPRFFVNPGFFTDGYRVGRIRENEF